MKETGVIGILTFHTAQNYGASLQAYALLTVLRGMGKTPVFVHYHPDCIDRLYRPFTETGLKKVFKLARMCLRKRPRRLLWRYVSYRRFLKRELPLFGDFTSYEALAAAFQATNAFSAVIAGSDQIWNGRHTGGLSPAYLLDFVPKGIKKISYAASTGIGSLPETELLRFKQSLRSFDAISVREAATARQLNEVGGLPSVSVTLDPALLLPWEAYAAIKETVHQKEPYLLVYMMEENEALAHLAETVSEALGIGILQRREERRFQNELASFFTHDPGQFLGDIANAAFVLTNSYHGLVFSILAQKPSAALPHSTEGARSLHLLQTLGLSAHLLDEKKCLQNGANFDTIALYYFTEQKARETQERLAQLRAESLAWLEQALK